MPKTLFRFCKSGHDNWSAPSGKRLRRRCLSCEAAASRRQHESGHHAGWWLKNRKRVLDSRKAQEAGLAARTGLTRHVRQRGYYLVAKYGISEDAYNTVSDRQGGLCAICKRPPRVRSLDVDHDHATGANRGLLCISCNTGLGRFMDDPKLLRAAAEYLEGVSSFLSIAKPA